MPKASLTELNEAHSDIVRAEQSLQAIIKMSEDTRTFNEEQIKSHKKNVKDLEKHLELRLLKGIYLNSLKS